MYTQNYKNGGAANLSCTPRLHLKVIQEGIFKSCFIELEYKNAHNIITGSIYRVPGTIYDDLINKMRLKKNSNENQNLDFLKLYNHRNTMEFLDISLSSKLIAVIT